MSKNNPDRTGLPESIILASLHEEPRRVGICAGSTHTIQPGAPAYLGMICRDYSLVVQQIKCASANLEHLLVNAVRLFSLSQVDRVLYFLESVPTYIAEGEMRPDELGVIARDLPLVESSMVALNLNNTGPGQLAVAAVLEEYTVKEAWDALEVERDQMIYSSSVLVNPGNTKKITLTLPGKDRGTCPMYKLKQVLLQTDQDPQGSFNTSAGPRSDLVYVQSVHVHSWETSIRRWPRRSHLNKARSFTEEKFATLSTLHPPPPGAGGQRVFFTEQVLVRANHDVPVDITVVNHSHEPVYALVTLGFEKVDVCQQEASAWKAFQNVVQNTTGRKPSGP